MNGRSYKPSFTLDPQTRIARTNVGTVVNIKYVDLARAEFIVGRGNIILKDKLNGRTGFRAGPADFAAYEQRAAQ